MPSPLSKTQKSVLCSLARRAWRMSAARPEAGRGQKAYEAFDIWRKAEQEKAVGRASLRLCDQGDYLGLRAHFENLIGSSGRALKTLLRDAETPRAVALHLLKQECYRWNFFIEYPAKICRLEYRVGLDEANPTQLMRLVYTVRNRGRARAAAASALKPAEAVHA